MEARDRKHRKDDVAHRVRCVGAAARALACFGVPLRLAAPLLLAAPLFATPLFATPFFATPAGGEEADRATATHSFDDVEHWVSVFDDPGRDAWQKPEEVVRALGIRAGDVVADLGAGTGYFSRYWSRAVGREGVVFAMEVEPALVAHLRDRADREGTANVVPVLGSKDEPRLPPGSVDLAVLVNTYHHIDHRRAYFERFRRVLAPGGRLVVIDWRKEGEFPVGPPPDHRLAAERISAELESAGYAAVGRLDPLPYQYVRIFRIAPAAEHGEDP